MQVKDKKIKLVLLPPKEHKEVTKEEIVEEVAKFINLIYSDN